jgi:DNA-binding Lrp family transcriptional regulator
MQHFDGATFDQARDGSRLGIQMERVRSLMEDGQWWTLGDIAEKIGAPTHSVSARIRDLRKERFGAHIVERRYVEKGLFVYRLKP